MDYRSSSSDDEKWTIEKGSFLLRYRELIELVIRVIIVLVLTTFVCFYLLIPGVDT